MTRSTLVARALGYYWRTNVAVVCGVATAVAVLSGALLVGDSVRGSLRNLVLQRLGNTESTATSTSFFREALAADLGAAPIIAIPGVVTEQASGRRASGVQVYGVDDRFWRFHGVADVSGPADREAFVSQALGREIGAGKERTVIVRVERPSAIPIESLQGRKDDPGRTLRLTVRAVLDRTQMGEFSMRPQQGDVLAVFVPLSRLQQDLGQARRVNALLAASIDAAGLTALLKAHAALDDYGVHVRALDARNELLVESDSGFIDRSRAEAIAHASAASDTMAHPVFSYLANTIRHGAREIPYSVVTALDLKLLGVDLPWLYEPDERNAAGPPPIRLNDWAARELDARPGDRVSLDYYVWRDTGDLDTATREFTVQAIVPLSGSAADRDLVPNYPGITTADSLSDWDPPFPIDLKRVRPADEEYWKTYRTTPKAFVPFELGQKLWGSRYGDRTSVRLIPIGQTLASADRRFESALSSALDPIASGFVVRDAREEGLKASNGSTDFGEYFVYFSFFLVVSALVLAALFFRLGVEQRAREVGLLRAVGFATADVRRLFLAEGLVLAVAGGAVGIAGAIGYGALMMAGLRTWWSGAVGTTALTLHVSAMSLAAGAAGAVLSAVLCIWWALRGLARLSERSLLAGEVRAAGRVARDASSGAQGAGRAGALAAITFAAIAAALVVAAAMKSIDAAGAFFGAGASVLIACLLTLRAFLHSRSAPRPPRLSTARLGARNTAERPGRSVLAVAVIASATFVLIAVDAFRVGAVDPADRRSGTGGYPLLVDLQFPLVHNPDSADGRDALGLGQDSDVTVEPFRVLPGEDTSCLNLYEPTRPRILGVGHRLINEGRFAFQFVPDDAARANPWLLLERPLPGGAIPAIADSNSLTYILHKKVGDEVVVPHGGRPLHLRIVAALSDSIFQRELLISDANFRALFPAQQGFGFLLVDAPAPRAPQIGNDIERAASDLGADAVPTSERLAAFHTVENTYLSTFQALGGLGLLVGTIGLAAVLLRNVLERRKELALLRAVGYRPRDLFIVVFAENVMLLVWGLAAGAVSASIAVIPAAAERGARVPVTAAGALLVAAVLVAGLLSSAAATRIAVRMPLVGALRSE